MTVVQHENTVRYMLHDAQVVRNHDQRRGRPGLSDRGERLQDLQTSRHIDGAHRLIGEYHVRFFDDRPAHRHALRLAAGQIHRISVDEHAGIQSDPFQRRVHVLANACGVGPAPPPSQGQRLGDDIADRPSGVQ